MPELPEVETTRRGIEPHIINRRIADVVIRNPSLRWPVPRTLKHTLVGKQVTTVRRRAKYLLIGIGDGTLIIHLGMSGSLRIVECSEPPRTHDHVDLVMDNDRAVRLHDPRRFGAVLWSQQPLAHPLLMNLGPEPWDVSAEHLLARSRKRRQAVKCFIMDSRIIVGVGNIYASESLFLAGIRPTRAAGRVAIVEYTRLRDAMIQVLDKAIAVGGTTLRDFVSATGEPGYFRQQLNVYERDGESCRICTSTIKRIVQVGRASYYCPQCQR
ncbi:MAG: bifunctional DNA-formamidopyrimidine glycosylase/DNA-(apurinic or apyrimidinic site) lyase [Gammaproteobacteria bacterium]